MNALREAARDLYQLRARAGWGAVNTALTHFTDGEVQQLALCWQLWARDNQLRPDDCEPIWLRLAGRGEGKTRSASEETLDLVEDWGESYRGALCSKTIGDVRDVMIRGESGLIACARRRGFQVQYLANQSLVKFWNRAKAHVFTSEKKDGPRGYEFNHIWGDEISAWQNAVEIFDNLMLAHRLPAPSGQPLATFTTTPRPNAITFLLAKSDVYKGKVTITKGRTRDNRDNLADGRVELLESLYLGTRYGRQELEGEIVESFGAIFEQDTIHRHRMRTAPELTRRVVSLDPSITANENSDAAGIIVVGSDSLNPPDAFVLADRTVEMATFRKWARAAIEAFLDFECDCIVAEVNQGGGGIVEAIQSEAEHISKELGREISVPVRSVWARESKRARAQPVGALYERGRVHHVGYFEQLEKEQTSWIEGMDSPNRLDALVHGVTHLLLGDKTVGPLGAYL